MEYNSSINAEFSLNLLTETPTHSLTPSLHVIFTQNEPYSWVEICLSVYNKSSEYEKSKQHMFSEDITIAEAIKNVTYSKVVTQLGSSEYELMFQLADQDSGLININVNSSFDTTYGAYQVSSSRHPLKLIWNAVKRLSKEHPTYSIFLPGTSDKIEITNLESNIHSLNVYWLLSPNIKDTNKDNRLSIAYVLLPAISECCKIQL